MTQNLPFRPGADAPSSAVVTDSRGGIEGPDYIIEYLMNGKDEQQYAVDERDMDRIVDRIRALGATEISLFRRIPTPTP